MCVRNAAVLLKKMRRISGMTQEEFTEGICSTVTLSKFEFVESREYDIYLYDLHVTLFIMEIYALCLKKIKKDNCFVVKLIKVFKDYFPEESNFKLSDALVSVLL